jgi:hypothetical protein
MRLIGSTQTFRILGMRKRISRSRSRLKNDRISLWLLPLIRCKGRMSHCKRMPWPYKPIWTWALNSLCRCPVSWYLRSSRHLPPSNLKLFLR